jgi:hypothetical protein
VKSNEQMSSLRRGAAMAPPGLDPYAEERAASMADEGGWAGAVMERQPQPTMPLPNRRRQKLLGLVALVAGAAAALVAMVARAARRR